MSELLLIMVILGVPLLILWLISVAVKNRHRGEKHLGE